MLVICEIFLKSKSYVLEMKIKYQSKYEVDQPKDHVITYTVHISKKKTLMKIPSVLTKAKNDLKPPETI